MEQLSNQRKGAVRWEVGVWRGRGDWVGAETESFAANVFLLFLRFAFQMQLVLPPSCQCFQQCLNVIIMLLLLFLSFLCLFAALPLLCIPCSHCEIAGKGYRERKKGCVSLGSWECTMSLGCHLVGQRSWTSISLDDSCFLGFVHFNKNQIYCVLSVFSCIYYAYRAAAHYWIFTLLGLQNCLEL